MLRYLAIVRQYMALWGAYMLVFYLSLVVFGIVALVALATHNIGSIDTSILDGMSYQTGETSGILELWMHELMRAAPMLVPGAGAVWGFIAVIPDVLTEPRDLAVARAESQYSDKLLLAWQFSCTTVSPEEPRHAASESWPAARLPAPMR